MENYREIQFGFGNLEDAIDQLKSQDDLVYMTFNGHRLYSDIDDIESAYKKVTGLTKTEFDEKQKSETEKYQEELRRHEESVPQLTVEWQAKGREILDKKYLEKWDKCVPIRLNDLYRGFELGACLDIVSELNRGCTLKEAKEIIEEQGHSGMSFGLVCSMVKSFCDRGADFVEFVK